MQDARFAGKAMVLLTWVEHQLEGLVCRGAGELGNPGALLFVWLPHVLSVCAVSE